MVVWKNSRQICHFWNGGSRAEITLLRAELHAILHRAFEVTSQCESWCADKGNVRSFAVRETWWIGCGRFNRWQRSWGLQRSVQVCWHGLFWWMERDTAHSSINQQIVVGKPVVSKDKGTGAIQWSDIKRCQSDITSFKAGGEGNCWINCAVHDSVEKTEFEWRNGVCWKQVFIHKVHVYKTIRRARVY